jgi:hypothetical protein
MCFNFFSSLYPGVVCFKKEGSQPRFGINSIHNEGNPMVQQLREDKPLYSCVIPIESVTGRPDEELMSFGASAEEVKHQAEQLLANDYGCNEDAIRQLMQQATVKLLSAWCSTNE